jgi:hypothetical protein
MAFDLPPLGAVQTLNWLVPGSAGDFVQVAGVELVVEVPALPTGGQAFLWSYAQFLANFTPETGLPRDRANFAAGEFDNISASGMQAAAATRQLTCYTEAPPACPRPHPPYTCYAQTGLFGLSAAEIPEPSLASPLHQIYQLYQPFGAGGESPPNDGRPSPPYPVVVPHYAGGITSLRPTESMAMSKVLQNGGLLTPLSNVESLMAGETRSPVMWNACKGSWACRHLAGPGQRIL